jgi:drug/metabolite transporter (DMT)-like permease
MILVAILYAVFAAMTFVNTSLMSSDPYPVLVGMVRALGSGGIIVMYFALFGKDKKVTNLKLSSHQWYLLFAYGILIHALGMCGFSYGAMYASPITICFLYASAPFLTAILLYLYSGTVLSRAKILGLLVGLMGIVPILWKNTATDIQVAVANDQWLGNIIVLVSMIFFCWGWILFKKLIQTCSYSVQMLNGIAMIIGGILSLVFVAMVYGSQVFEITFSENFIYLMTLFLLSSLLTYSLYAYLLQHFSPTFISFAGFLEPVFALLYGVLWFEYTIRIVDVVSFLILFLGLYIFYRQELGKEE